MIKIAILEDEKEHADKLEEFLNRYAGNETFDISVYSSALDLNYSKIYDVFFLDINMPSMSGMEAARKIRDNNQDAIIVFVTSMAQYALQGYEVQALDFMIKPITYEIFSLKMDRIMRILKKRRDVSILCRDADGRTINISSSDILYIEIYGHRIKVHTSDNIYERYGTLKEMERELEESNMLKCNSCFLINPDHVKGIKGFDLYIGDDTLAISHKRKKEFMDELSKYLGRKSC